MIGTVEVLLSVLIFRTIAAAHVTAGLTQPKVNPRITHLQTFFAALSAWSNLFNLVSMGTLRISHRCLKVKIAPGILPVFYARGALLKGLVFAHTYPQPTAASSYP